MIVNMLCIGIQGATPSILGWAVKELRGLSEICTPNG